MRYVLVSIIAIFAANLFAMEDFDKQQIEERIKPVGSVRLEQQKTATEQQPQTAKVEEKKEPGQATYEQYCSTCHKTGLAGAPKFQDAADWKPRMANRDINALAASAIKGLNAMPPKGTCQECSEQDIKDAIHYMLPKS